MCRISSIYASAIHQINNDMSVSMNRTSPMAILEGIKPL